MRRAYAGLLCLALSVIPHAVRADEPFASALWMHPLPSIAAAGFQTVWLPLGFQFRAEGMEWVTEVTLIAATPSGLLRTELAAGPLLSFGSNPAHGFFFQPKATLSYQQQWQAGAVGRSVEVAVGFDL